MSMSGNRRGARPGSRHHARISSTWMYGPFAETRFVGRARSVPALSAGSRARSRRSAAQRMAAIHPLRLQRRRRPACIRRPPRHRDWRASGSPRRTDRASGRNRLTTDGTKQRSAARFAAQRRHQRGQHITAGHGPGGERPSRRRRIGECPVGEQQEWEPGQHGTPARCIAPRPALASACRRAGRGKHGRRSAAPAVCGAARRRIGRSARLS